MRERNDETFGSVGECLLTRSQARVQISDLKNCKLLNVVIQQTFASFQDKQNELVAL